MDLLLLVLECEHPENQAQVGEILEPIVERDILTPDSEAIDLAALEPLKTLGEQRLYDKVAAMVKQRG